MKYQYTETQYTSSPSRTRTLTIEEACGKPKRSRGWNNKRHITSEPLDPGEVPERLDHALDKELVEILVEFAPVTVRAHPEHGVRVEPLPLWLYGEALEARMSTNRLHVLLDNFKWASEPDDLALLLRARGAIKEMKKEMRDE